MATHVIEMVTLLLAYVALLLKEEVNTRLGRMTGQPKTRQLLRALYWLGVGVVGLGPIVTEGAQWRRESQTKDLERTVRTFDETRSRFNRALDSQKFLLIEDELTTMAEDRKALDKMRQTEDLARQYYLYVLNDLALAYERVAYADADHACIYRVELDDTVSACRAPRDAQVGSSPRALNKLFLQCTNISAEEDWRKARDAYTDTEILLESIAERQEDGPDIYAHEIVSATRNVAYFYLCDQLRNGVDHWARLDTALTRLSDKTKGMYYRSLDAKFKRRIFDILKHGETLRLDCTKECGADVLAETTPQAPAGGQRPAVPASMSAR